MMTVPWIIVASGYIIFPGGSILWDMEKRHRDRARN